MASKTASFHDLIRTLFLILLLSFWLQNQNRKFLCLDKIFVPDSFAWFLAIKFEMRIFWFLIKTLFLVLLLRFWLQNQNSNFLCLVKAFAPYSFAWFMAIKFETGIFLDLIKTLFLVLLLSLWLQTPKPEVSMTWQDLCFLFLLMVLISNKGSFYNLTWFLFLLLRL